MIVVRMGGFPGVDQMQRRPDGLAGVGRVRHGIRVS